MTFMRAQPPACCAGKAARRTRLVLLLILAVLALAPLLARPAPLAAEAHAGARWR